MFQETNLFISKVKDSIAKRYTLRYILNKWKEAVSEYLWLATIIALGFFVVLYFGGHIMAQCLVNNTI